MQGVLVIDKPRGPTSHDVVGLARRVLGEKRIGHTGTLDPMATGVLPLVIGKATRLASLLAGASKTYVAGIRLGCATDTYDATGRVNGDPESPVAEHAVITPPPELDSQSVAAALDQFRGTFEQRPPAYSAKKIGGMAAYKMARRQQEVAPAPVEVSVSELTLMGYADGLATVRVTATAGFYVRSLAHDLGAALGCGGHLASLRRTRSGEFGEEAAMTLDVLAADPASAAARVIPLERLLRDLPAARLTEGGAARVGHGNAVAPGDLADPGLDLPESPGPAGGGPARIRLLDPDGRLLGLAEPRPGGLLQPVVVLV